ncbi:MAG: putative outer rane autotransporter barrel precursor, partial [Bryobacterales bacterium]|nr:putative outer rane autotransporter barrel precursor [Bryobacterales bacterium]
MISGGNYGVFVANSAGTVINAGSITGTHFIGVYLREGGSVTNQAGGVISGGSSGVYVNNGAGTVTNAGSITGGTGATNNGVLLSAGGSVTNQAGGAISGYTGVDLKAGGSVTNQAGGVISGGNLGVYVAGGAGTVTDAGTITSMRTAIYLQAGGSVINYAGGTIKGGGGATGVYILGIGTVSNAGTITGGNGVGVRLGTGGSVTNQTGGSINGGTGGSTGVLVYTPTATISTVTNAGTITGGTSSVNFTGGGANVLTLQTGSVLNGTALGSTAGGATNALILQGTGTANNNFVNFNTLDKQASGLWALNSSPTIGATTVDGGTLAIGDAGHAGATLTSPVSVNAGGTLAGFGTVIGNVALASGGAVQGGVPGAIGTLNISGNLTFNSGGILSTTIVPSGAASLVNVTAGTAALTGGTVQVTASSFITHTQTFTILTATTLSGAFSSASMAGTAFARNPRLTEDAHDVFLTVDSGSFAAVLPASASVNQVNVAKAIDAGLAGGGTLPAGFVALGNLPVTSLPGALTQLSGETASGSQQTTFGAMTQFMGVMTDPFIGGRGDASSPPSGATPFAEENDSTSAYAANGKPRNKRERDAYAMFTKAPPASFDARWSVWAAGFGGSQTTDGNATLGSNNTSSRLGAVAVGADYRFSPDTIAGFALAGGGTNFSVANGGTGRSDLFQAGAFVRHTVGPAYISAALAYGWQDVTTDRTITVAGIDQLHAEFNANAFSGRVEGGYRFVSPWIGGVGITPYAAGQFTTFDLPAYAESALVGSNAFALAYGSKSVTDTRSELGLRTDKSFAMQSAILTLRGRLAWAHDFNPDRSIGATF